MIFLFSTVAALQEEFFMPSTKVERREAILDDIAAGGWVSTAAELRLRGTYDGLLRKPFTTTQISPVRMELSGQESASVPSQQGEATPSPIVRRAPASMNYVGLDIETTGLDVNRHGMIQIGVAFGVLHGWQYDIDPTPCEIDQEALDVNKFTLERIRNGHGAEYVDSLMFRAMKDRGYSPQNKITPVGYNVGSFDLSFIKKALPNFSTLVSHRVVDLSSIAMFLAKGGDDWRKLKEEGHRQVEAILGGEPHWHSAKYDATAALLQWHIWLGRTQEGK